MGAGFWDDAEVISSYSRAQALADGVLDDARALVPDEPNFVDEAGFRCPVAMTASVAALVLPTELEAGNGQDVKGRLWDLLNMARFARPRPLPDEGCDWLFRCIFAVERDRPGVARRAHPTYTLKANIAGGDDGEPVVTIMLPTED